MKLKLIILLFITTICTIQTNAQNSASNILENALTQAKAENKNVFVKYSASWCGWCKKMDRQMKSDSCKSFFDANYVTVTLVVKESKNKKHLENPGAIDFLKKHKGEKAGLPFWAILDNTGVLMEDSYNAKGENIGCPATDSEVADFITILKKTSNLTDENLNIISEIFLSK
ncbi:thioredoxin family protein [Dokdonia sp.]|uniref:thioredoxin family protein n=1 Tax=Dokdonia sp. TaxID=2024995 RepID=UPI0032677292